jgi:SHS family lactate transporter-like MFS transporter
MSALSMIRSLNRQQRNTLLASFLGWSLDAFDFFLLTFVTKRVADEFHVGLPAIIFTLTLTLAVRPIGAFIFGLLAERFGRRIPLMIDILLYSLMELLTAFSPNYTVFLILRVLFGVGMGGEWGVGSSLAMEALPARSRGFFSGLLQEGYAFGYLLGAIVFFSIFNLVPGLGWRAMFVVGSLPALLVFFIRRNVPESPVWMQQQQERQASGSNFWQSIWNEVKRYPVLFVYIVILMTAFNSISHGTQDNFPTFLQTQILLGYDKTTQVTLTTVITMIGNIGAIGGGLFFGYHSERWGRRGAIIIAGCIALLMIPLWSGMVRIPSVSVVITIGIGIFLLQFMVQGAWGVIPAHLNELSPSTVRGTFPGFTYQLGNLFASGIVTMEALVAENLGTAGAPDYALALVLFSVGSILAVIIFTVIGREAKGVEFMKTDSERAELGSVKSAPTVAGRETEP